MLSRYFKGFKTMNILITQDKNIQFLFKLYYFIFLLIILSVLTSLIFTNNFYQKTVTTKNALINTDEKDLATIYISDLQTVKSLQQNELIHDFHIDNVRKTKIVPNIVIAQLPRDLKNIKSIKNRKDLFIKITLPLIVQENEKLLSLNKKIKSIKNSFDKISRKEADWVNKLMVKYRADTLDALLIKVDKIPVSLALAQAVIESGWGTSRFAYEGNALFGQYVWGSTNHGIIPNDRETDAKYKIKSFDSLSESVASYMKNLNTNFHYNEFRINRFVLRSNNIPLRGMYLAEYLLSYSIEDNYTDKIKNIIEINDFEDFENINIEKQLPLITDII
jgi:Bax protein